VYFPKFKNITCIHSNTLAYLRTALVKPAIVEPNLTRLPDYIAKITFNRVSGCFYLWVTIETKQNLNADKAEC